MVHVHGQRVQLLVKPIRQFPPDQVVAVAVDAGKARGVARFSSTTSGYAAVTVSTPACPLRVVPTT